uniref:Uncharacterized protein n=1 Tax=Anguilla anguilla TaxID=7936 RepID=A0A0E9W9F0_ANGAN
MGGVCFLLQGMRLGKACISAGAQPLWPSVGDAVWCVPAKWKRQRKCLTRTSPPGAQCIQELPHHKFPPANMAGTLTSNGRGSTLNLKGQTKLLISRTKAD